MKYIIKVIFESKLTDFYTVLGFMVFWFAAILLALAVVYFLRVKLEGRFLFRLRREYLLLKPGWGWGCFICWNPWVRNNEGRVTNILRQSIQWKLSIKKTPWFYFISKPKPVAQTETNA